MKKMTKLLSVILAFVMALSCMTMMASAAKAKFQTVADLESYQGGSAYSPYGTVTRLPIEVRTTLLLDALDNQVLVNVNLKFEKSIALLGDIYVNLASVNEICKSLDSIYSLLKKGLSGALVTIAKSSLGIIADLNVNSWQTGMTRENAAQYTIVQELFELLGNNGQLINTILTDGIDLGLINGALPDLSAINNLVKNIPSAIKGLVFSMMGRPDDDGEQRTKLSTKTNDLIQVAQSFVNGLFTKPMNWTSYRVDENGNDLGYTTALPMVPDATSRYFVKNEDGSITQYDYQYEGLLGDPVAGYAETVTYTLSDTEEYEGSGTYLYKAPEGYDGDQTLKWYKNGNKVDDNGRIQSSYWLPSVKAAMDAGTLTLNINGDDSLIDLLYKFVPYIFREMAPTILNGSAKKLIAEAFDVEFTKIGVKGSAAVTAEATATGNPGSFFTKDQDYYVWEYSDYMVTEDGTPYYRFQDTYFKGEIPKNISAYYSMFDWNWNISDDFMDEFIPTANGTKSQAGYDWALEGLNDLVKKAIDTMIVGSWTVKGTTYTRAEVFNWEAGDNSKLLNNFMVCARNFFNIAPEEIVDEYFSEAQFYDKMMNGTLKQAVNGLTCELVKLIMPQIKFADNIVDQPITAIAAVVVRELCTQLMPTYNFDAMIFANYGDSSNKTRTMLTGKSADYWLDTTLYMGVNLGMYYLRNIADVGEDSELGYYKAMKKLNALPADTADGMTFAATSQYVGNTAAWLYQIDWIADWALEADIEWCWQFERFIDLGTVDLATYQNPFEKLNTILLKLLPLDNIFNVSHLESETCVYGSNTFLEKVLKNGIVDSIVNLDVKKLQGLLKVPEGYLTNGHIADNLVLIIKGMLNNILYRLAGNANIVPDSINSVNTLLDQNNLKATLSTLVDKLDVAFSQGLFEPVLPIVNFFFGWTTDPQKFADPAATFSNAGNGDHNAPIPDYFYTGGAETITVINKASGMLLKHRNATGNLTSADSAYTITVKSIASDDGTITCSQSNVAVSPGESKDFTITTSDKTTSRMARVIITYTLTGKDGSAIGGTRTSETYIDVSKNCHPGDYAKTFKNGSIMVYINAGWSISGRDGIVVTNSNREAIRAAVEDLYINVVNWRDKELNIVKKNYNSGTPNIVPNTENLNAFTQVAKKGADGENKTCNFAKLADSVDVTTIPSGTVWSLGSFDIQVKSPDGSNKTDSDSKTLGYLYYADLAALEKLFNEEILKNRAPANYTTASFNAYATAMKDIGAYISPRMIRDNGPEYFAANYTDTKIAEKLAAFKTAINGLKAAGAASGVGIVQNKLNELETNPDRDINFQDYSLFEYFQYEKQRTAAREMIKNSTAPSMPENYIENGVWGNDLITAIVNAQASANVKAGINATVVEPTAAEKSIAAQAIADFVPASYSDLEIEDQKVKLQHYYNYMVLRSKSVDTSFLQKEIAYAEAQNYVADKYSTDSWSRYTDALAKATAALTSTKESEVFDAKYELMVAQNKLQYKERSMKEVGYMNEELIPLIQAANAIIDNFGTLYTTKSNITDADAFAQLVRALGIDYDVTIDGKEYSGILYDRSALTFAEYDRTATAKNKRTVDVAADKLREAIENFECTAKLEAAAGTQVEVEQGIRYIKNVHPNSVPTVEALLAKVNVTGATGAEPVVTKSKNGYYGTGARIDVVKGDHLLASYFVVIDGDVNGDGAVDAFDAIEVDVANHTAYYMGDVYDDAADLNGDGLVDANDYSSLTALVMCTGA